mmetsp:Transcript_47568/g.101075  ORF Transcript_47568/g.101075 Transcript_47568/m.101075 type:complete len:410 (+) Transcript_47568:154-1383(+)
MPHTAQIEGGDDDDPVLKLTMETGTGSAAKEEATPSKAEQSSSLSIFHEDVILSMLSYVADVPFEMAEAPNARAPIDSHSTLTHTLPLVCKQFHKLTRHHDLHWKHALLRLMRKEPTLWEEGLKRVMFDSKCDELRAEIMERNRRRATRRRDKRTKYGQLNQQQENPTPQAAAESVTSASSYSVEHLDNPSPSDREELLQRACMTIQAHPPRHHTATSSGVYQCLYQSVLLGHMRYQAPVFYMPSAVRLGSTYGLHFFEPRYRVLMSEVMASYPVSARRGQPISPMVPGLFPPQRSHGQVMADDMKAFILDLLEKNESMLRNYQLPSFIHAHQSPLRRNTPATIVQVQQCVIQPDGSADVFLEPLSYIWLEEIWERPGTGGLFEARGIRMGKDASESYELYCVTSGTSR